MGGLDPAHLERVQLWLGQIDGVAPEGLHGPRRRRLLERYSSPTGHFFRQALAITYPRNRERPVMMLLRPQALDDQLWRSVYAIMITGRPLRMPSLVSFVARITGPRDIANAEAEKLYSDWFEDTYVAA